MGLMTFPSILLVVIAQSDEAGRLAGGTKSKVGKLADPIGKTTAVRSEVMGSSFSSWRTASLVDSRRVFFVRIWGDWALMGVLATGAVSACVFTVGGSGRLTTWTGVLTDSFLTGGPKVGRRLFIANPAI